MRAATKILLVDDDANLLDGLQRALRRQFVLDTALGGDEALEKIATSGPYALIVADMRMPGMTGIEFLRRVQEVSPDSVRMMLTGNSDLQTAVDAVNEGRVFRYLTKPCAAPELAPILAEGLDQYRMRFVEREVLETTLSGTVKVLMEILSLLDPVVFSRSQRLKDYVHQFCRDTGASSAWENELAAMLSQIGRVTIPRDLIERLAAAVPLTETEETLLARVPELGADLLENIPRLGYVATMVRYQQKHFDGSGVPSDALCGENIPYGSRLLKIFTDLIELEDASFTRHDAFVKMQEFADRYDPALLMAVWDWCNHAFGTSRDNTPTRLLTLEELQSGYVLAEDICSREGLLILSGGSRLTPMLLAKLQNFRALGSLDNVALIYEPESDGFGVLPGVPLS
jgi:response regulator RpfG family c-di-GMP phosphodiesterase